MESFQVQNESEQEITMGIPYNIDSSENLVPVQEKSSEIGIQSIEKRQEYNMPGLAESRKKARISMYNYKNLKNQYEKLGSFITDPEFFEEGVYTITGQDTQRGKYLYVGTLDPDMVERDGVGI